MYPTNASLQALELGIPFACVIVVESQIIIIFDCRFELALQQNEIMDVFFDDWKALADEDSTFGSKSDNHLKVFV